MRRIAFTLVGLVGLVVSGNQVALAHGHVHAYRSPVGHYANHWGGSYVGGYGVGYGGYGAGYGGYGCGPRYAGYAAPYGYAYPQPGFSLSVPNFSLFVR
jgi:hypothetical protein